MNSSPTPDQGPAVPLKLVQREQQIEHKPVNRPHAVTEPASKEIVLSIDPWLVGQRMCLDFMTETLLGLRK